MKKSLGVSLSAVILSLAIPVLFLMMMSSALSQTTTGIMADSQGDRQSFFDLYYREPIMNTQKEKNVLVPFGWLYGAMWYNNSNEISQEKVNEMIKYAYVCDKECKLVSLDEFVMAVKPHLSDKEATIDELKKNIQLFEDSDQIYFGDIPSKMSDYKGLEMALPLPSNSYQITARFGMYDPWGTGDWHMHNAIDLAPNDGQEGHPLYSMIEGTISGKGYDANGWGNYIVVQSIKYPEFSIRFAHMQKPSSLVIGESVKIKQSIGLLGNTGDSTGAHVHVEFMEKGKRFNPELVYKFD
ncbi:M23 family metallopeptidase [Erysipelothrix rhusiopathiae]|nr:M23 family metallopeptidase [Erysipelothrix rhusiopathiae]